jgi:hypothetical protein
MPQLLPQLWIRYEIVKNALERQSETHGAGHGTSVAKPFMYGPGLGARVSVSGV